MLKQIRRVDVIWLKILVPTAWILNQEFYFGMLLYVLEENKSDKPHVRANDMRYNVERMLFVAFKSRFWNSKNLAENN